MNRLTTCGDAEHFDRRTLLGAGALGVLSWLTPVARQLARAAEQSPRRRRPRSVIVLWLQGGPSQLETFDPHPGTEIAAGTKAIKTSVPEILLAGHFPQLAEQMDHVSLVRSVVSEEGDHERATYYVKTGFRPVPALTHPSLGAVVCHELPDDAEIPRHVSILPGQWPARGGYLGDQYDAFKVGDPRHPVPDIRSPMPQDRLDRRVDDLLNVVEQEFARGRLKDIQGRRTFHQHSVEAALRMMSSEQLDAFNVSREPASVLAEYGDTPFGRGCLAALRLIQAGVRCVEVTLSGWDSHVNNHETQAERAAVLDPAFATLIRDLRQRDLFDDTVVLCGGEFGRTPKVNGAGGRDHWPHGFTVALAGGGVGGGRVVGETSPEPRLEKEHYGENVKSPKRVADIHATVLAALGIDHTQMLDTPVGRPMVLSDGDPIRELLG